MTALALLDKVDAPAKSCVVRLATEADIQALVELGTEFLENSEYAAFCTPNPEAMARTLAVLIGAGTVWVGEGHGRVLGMIGLAIFDHPYSGERVASELFWWVSRFARGCLGIRLLAHAEREATALGAVHIQMIAPNPRVGTLYARRGYQSVETAWQKRLG